MPLGSIADSVFGPDVNFVPERNVYPGATGPTTGSIGAAASPDDARYQAGSPDDGLAGAQPPVGLTGHPVMWWVGLAVMVGLIWWLAHKVGKGGDFANLRASTFNVVMITMIAVLGLTIGKAIFSKVRIPGLSDVFLAA